MNRVVFYLRFFPNRVLRVMLILIALCVVSDTRAQEFRFLPDVFSQVFSSLNVAQTPPAGATATSYNDELYVVNHTKWSDMVANPSTWNSKYTFKSVVNTIRVGINQDIALAVPNYKYKITLQVLGYTNPAAPASYETKNLIFYLEYSKDSLIEYQDRNTYKLDASYHSMKVILTGISDVTNGTPVNVNRADVAKNFFIETSVTTQRYDYDQNLRFFTNSSYDATKGELLVTWLHHTGTMDCAPFFPYTDNFKPAKYEVEWTYIDDYVLDGYTHASGSSHYDYTAGQFSVNYNFKNNATRIQTYNSRFSIPVVYEHGVIVFRVRTLRPDPDNYNLMTYSDWNLPESGTLTNSSFSGSLNGSPYRCPAQCMYLINTAFSEDKFNWQYSINFAEEGKYKHVLNYFDGAGHGRQTLTRINTDLNYIIAADKIYDYEGRPGIQTLPIPVLAQSLEYKTKLSLKKSDNPAPYVAADFDFGCMTDSIAPFDTSSLASRYYSSTNPDKTGMQQFVPSAKGYPFVETIFSADNTNKVLWQGGAGQEFQRWRMHGTRTTYVRAEQQELNRLMGTEAGRSEYYPKQIVTDPNGQSSYTIFDQDGKTVATALLGAAPEADSVPIVPLDNISAARSVTTDILANLTQQAADGRRSAEHSFFPEAGGNNGLRYRGKIPPYATGCGSGFINVQGFYQLKVLSECGDSITGQKGTAGITSIATNGTAQYFAGDSLNFNLPPDKYTLVKELYFPDTTIIRMADSFTDLHAKIGDCYIYQDSFIRRSVDAAIFPCPAGDTISHCDMLKRKMMDELYPGAKYGTYNTSSTTGNFLYAGVNSIFSEITVANPNPGMPSLPGPVIGGIYAEDAWREAGSNNFAPFSQWSYANAVPPINWLPAVTTGVNDGVSESFTNPLPYDMYVGIKAPLANTNSYFFKTNVYITDVNANNNVILKIKQTYAAGGALGGVWVNGMDVGAPLINAGPIRVNVTLYNFHTGWNEVKIQINPQQGVSEADHFRFTFQFQRLCGNCDNGSTTTTSQILRYQSGCMNLPQVFWPGDDQGNWIAGSASNAPPDAFIKYFNDSIAVGLLPLHPEYCKLLLCNDDLEERLAYVKTYEQAVALGVSSLEDLWSHDPLCQVSDPTAPFSADQLSYFSFDFNSGLAGNPDILRRLDTFSLEQAYCGCDGPEAYLYCRSNEYADQIRHMVKDNEEIRNLYVRKLIANYLANRNLLKQQMMDATGMGCGQCQNVRMFVEGESVFPVVFDGGNFDPGNDVPAWVKDAFQAGIDGTTNSVPPELSLEAGDMKHDQCQQQVQQVVDALKNCMPLANQNGIYNDLMNLHCDPGGSGNTITPDMIKTVLLNNSISLNDLCGPFLVEYGLYDERKNKISSPYVNKPIRFYKGLKDFLNRGEIESAIAAAAIGGGTSYTGILIDPVNNPFEQELAQVLSAGSNLIDARAYIKTVPYTPFLHSDYICLVLNAGANRDTLYLARRKMTNPPSTCSPLTFPVKLIAGDPAEFSFLEIHSTLDDPSVLAQAEGYIADNVVFATLDGYAYYTTSTPQRDHTCDNYTIWSHSIPMMKPRDPEGLDDCIHCELLRQTVNVYNSDAAIYGMPTNADHPMFARSLSNYLNYRLGKNHTYEEYEALMHGCALSDKIMFRKAYSHFEVNFTSEANAGTFLSALATAYPAINIGATLFRYNSPDVGLWLDLSSVPYSKTWEVKKYVTDHSASPSYMPLAASSTGVAEVFVQGSCMPSFSGIANLSIAATATYELKDLNNNWVSYTRYSLESSGTLKEKATALQALKAYLAAGAGNCAIGLVQYHQELFRSKDYVNADKQAYLDYVYGLGTSGLTTEKITAQIAPAALQANAGIGNITSANLVSYRDPWCGNVREDMYYGPHPTTAHAGWNRLSTILTQVKAALGNSALFPVAPATTASPGALGSGGTSLKVFRMSNKRAWYRLFNQQNRLYNVYLIPSEEMIGDANGYQMVVNSLTAIAGADSLYRFKVQLQKNMGSGYHVVTCYGYTDFSLGSSRKLDHVVLAWHGGNRGCIDTFTCERQVLADAIVQGKIQHAAYIDSIKERHVLAMRSFFPANTVDTLLFNTQKRQYQYTLYYYDLAGNLTRTVPPAGVDTLNPANTALIDGARNAGNTTTTAYLPVHRKVSRYKYNSFDQLIWQQTPDADSSEFFYDAASRLVFSQNAKQRPDKEYSYTLYDDQSRIIETGSIFFVASEYTAPNKHPNMVRNASVADAVTLRTSIWGRPRKDIVATFYDNALLTLAANPGLSAQENLRKRVSSVLYARMLVSGDTIESYYNYGTHFSYDALGNVSTLTQDNPYMDYLGQRFKRIDYDYDLLSGKVNMLSYNRGRADQYFQRYEYDADNRIVKAMSSNDGLAWDRDAEYSYYKHGPLAQMQMGDLNVQSVQYAYTLQGWLKAINGDIMRPEDDMGNNGQGGGLYPPDVITHALQYYKGDYVPIGTKEVSYTDNTNPLGKSLYNGNIARQTTGMWGMDNLQRTYEYDQLNRLKKTSYMKVNNDLSHTVVAMANATAFRNAYSYDNDGNIKTLTRKNAAGMNIDTFVYTYVNATANNKLARVVDYAANTGGNDLRQGQAGNNYEYDAIGNLTKDVQGRLSNITWNLYGKVTDIAIGVDTVIHYDYDAMGNRVRKDYTRLDGSTGFRKSDVYVRDAAGNILAVYKGDIKIDGPTIDWVNDDINTEHGTWVTPSGTGIVPFINSQYGSNSEFSTSLIQMGATENAPWAAGQSASLSLQQYLDQSEAIYSQAVSNELWNYFRPMATYDKSIITSTFATNDNEVFAVPFLSMLSDTSYTVSHGTLLHLTNTSATLTNTMLTTLRLSTTGTAADKATRIYNYVQTRSPNTVVAAFLDATYKQTPPTGFYDALVMDTAILTQAWFNNRQSIANNLATSIKNQATRSTVSGFFSEWLSVYDTAWLSKNSSQEQRLQVVYNANRKDFLVSYLDHVGIHWLNESLRKITGLSVGSYIFSVRQAVLTGTLNPGYQPPDVNTPRPDNIIADTISLAEHHLYGSSRLGIKTYAPDLYRVVYSSDNGGTMADSSLNLRRPWYSYGFADWIKKDKASPYSGSVYNLSLDTLREIRRLGSKRYELTDHLGNVLVTVLDKRTPYGLFTLNGYDQYTGFYANLAGVTDYYPFGMPMPGRKVQYGSNRFGFNGKEEDNEVYGAGNFQDYGFRMYDTRIARFVSVDPLAMKYPFKTSYDFAENTPIWAVDLDGLESKFSVYKAFLTAANGIRSKLEEVNTAAKVTNNLEQQAQVGVLKWLNNGLYGLAAMGGQQNPQKKASTIPKCGGDRPYSREQKAANKPTKPAEPMAADVDRVINGDISEKTVGALNIGSMMLLFMAEETAVNTATRDMTWWKPNIQPKPIPSDMITVGRWMLRAEYDAMITTGRIVEVEGKGGLTFVAIGGPGEYTAAEIGSVYVEFQIAKKSLLQGGKSNWFKAVGPSAGNTMKVILKKQGGELLPKIENLSPILKTKGE